jgi:hypothetical protein
MNTHNTDKQVISKNRVTNYGEVFTNKREVNAMLDLIKYEAQRIDSRFLEPACGNGNFLAEILERKLNIVKKKYSKNQIEYEKYAILALSSIYGVEILQNNVKECRNRLLGIFTRFYLGKYKNKHKPNVLKTAEFILDRNIIWGDALGLRTPDKKKELIVFSEWALVKGNLIKRRDFKMQTLLDTSPFEKGTLFSDLGDKAYIPIPVADFPLVDFLKVGQK